MLGRRTRRVVSLGLAVTVAVTASLLGAPAGPAAAAGLPSCPDGFNGIAGNSAATLRCINSNGDYEGYVDANGFNPVNTATPIPAEADVPSSVMAAGEGSTTTVAEGAGLAELDVAEGGGAIEVAASNPATSVAAGVAVAGVTGYELGTQFDHFACGFGLSSLCTPPKSANYTPNTDIPTTPNDPGWKNGVVTESTTDGNGKAITLTYASGTNMNMNAGTTPSVLQVQVTSSIVNSDIVTGYRECQVGSATPIWYADKNVSFNSNSSIVINGTYSTAYPNASPSPGYVCGGPGQTFVAYGFNLNGGADYATGVGAGNGTPPAVVYYPKGSSLRGPTVTTTPNPARLWETDNTCTATSSAGTTTTQTATSVSFTETDSTFPPFPEPGACPAGTALTVTKVYELTPSTSGRKIIETFTVPQAVTNWQGTYPQCANGACRLGLYKNNPDGVKADGQSCFDNAVDCSGWFQDPTKTNDYTCTYGPLDSASDPSVALSECNAYSPTFNPDKQAQGIPYGDPATGQAPKTSNPTQTNNPSPGAAGSGTDASCWPSSGFHLSLTYLLGFIYLPIECALKWAFVPDGSVITQTLSDTWTTLSTRPPISVIAPMVAVASHFVTTGLNGNCTGNIADFGNALTVPCSPPSAVTAFLTPIYVLVEIGICIAAAFGIWRMVEAGIGQEK